MSEYIPTLTEQIAGGSILRPAAVILTDPIDLSPPPAWLEPPFGAMAIDSLGPRKWEALPHLANKCAPARIMFFESPPSTAMIAPIQLVGVTLGDPRQNSRETVVNPPSDSPYSFWYESPCILGRASSLTLLNPFEDQAQAYTRLHTKLSLDLDKMEKLPLNWDEDGASQISRASLASAKAVSRSAALLAALSQAQELPYFLPLPDGDVMFKWVTSRKELSVTIRGSVLEVTRWQPRDAYEAQGYWETSTSGVREHLSWLVQ